MPMPKALLCLLGETAGGSEEVDLRAAGFATAIIRWRELSAMRFGWMQLAGILDDPSVCAWVMTGAPEDFTPDVLAQTTLLMLSLRRPHPPVLAILSQRPPVPHLPMVIGNHARVFSPGEVFAGRLMAARFKPAPTPTRPCHLQPHLDPLAGLWLEVGPPREETWNGFMIGTLAAEVAAFGVGPRGMVPRRTTLAHPICGIQGEVEGKPFGACAARNIVSESTACFVLVQGTPHGMFVGDYPEGQTSETSMRVDFVN